MHCIIKTRPPEKYRRSWQCQDFLISPLIILPTVLSTPLSTFKTKSGPAWYLPTQAASSNTPEKDRSPTSSSVPGISLHGIFLKTYLAASDAAKISSTEPARASQGWVSMTTNAKIKKLLILLVLPPIRFRSRTGAFMADPPSLCFVQCYSVLRCDK